MTRLVWDASGSRRYEIGVDRGVLYVGAQPGVPWNGLISVEEKPSGGTPAPYYLDGVRYLNDTSVEEFAATLSAYTYPDEFDVCDGASLVNTGLFAMHQPRVPFSLAYRTLSGNDVSGNSLGYKLHFVYNVTASPTQRGNSTIKDSSDPLAFSWDLACTPPSFAGFAPTAHVVLESRLADAGALADIEDILYGTATTSPRIPTLTELNTIVGYHNHLITLVDNFNDGVINPAIWTIQFGASSFAETGGVLQAKAVSNQYGQINGPANFDLSSGIVAARLTYTGVPTSTDSTELFFGARDSAGNAVKVLSKPLSDYWNFNTDGLVTLTPYTGPYNDFGTDWTNGDYVGMGNLGADNILHLYKSHDGNVWTEIATSTVSGTFNKTAVGISIKVGVFDSSSTTFIANFDDASYFHAP